MSSERTTGPESAIAIVGMAGRFPGARNTREFWTNLRSGVESSTWLTDEELVAAGVDGALLRDPHYVRAAYPLPEMDGFDAEFFGFSPRDAAITDPQHRHFLECAWSAFEDAGHVPSRFDGSVGVYAGCGANTYMMFNLLTNPALLRSTGYFLLRHTGNDKDFLATRVSYEFDLRGPSVNVQTACSTSLVAIHQAAQALLNGECDMALAGASTIKQPHTVGYLYKEGEIMSPDGHCRAFDASSEGTVFGSGVGVVVLRRLEDAIADGDHVYAVIRGSAINNDGAQKVGYLAPSVDGQARAIEEALAVADVHPDTIAYIETHGTGTPVGDPIEIAALTEAFRRKSTAIGYCRIGSLKTNVGHLDTAAGVASVIKTALALQHGEMPPSLHFERPNPSIDFASSPFIVNQHLHPWPKGVAPRRAGVSSLGAGGTNAHLILEEAPEVDPSEPTRASQLLVLSAKSPAALDAAAAALAARLREEPELPLADVAYTLQVGREAFPHRRIAVARSTAAAADLLAQPDPKRSPGREADGAPRSLAFMFAGGGAQYAGMGADLYRSEPVYRETVDACLRILRPHLSVDLATLLIPAPGTESAATKELERPSLALPALFTTQYAMAKLLESWGITPSAMIGHSMGEYTAACLAGVFSLEDALALVALRGRLFETVPEGGMLSVPVSADELRQLLGPELSIAAENAPELSVASGPLHAIAALERTLAERELEGRRIHINIAAHSAMLEPILAEFGAFFSRITLRAPTLPFVSNVSGTWITAAEATDAKYWVRHLRQTVRFADGVSELLADPARTLLEVGPGRTLATLAGLHSAKRATHAFVTSMRHPDEDVPDVDFLLTAVGRLWLHGGVLQWSTLHGDSRRRRVPLPTYQFQHQRYYIEPGKPTAVEEEPAAAPTKRADVGQWFYHPSWRRAPLTAMRSAGGRVLVFHDIEGVGARLAASLRDAGRSVVAVTPGTSFQDLGAGQLTIDPANPAHYEALLDALAADGGVPTQVVHLWNVTPVESFDHATADRAAERSFYGPLYLAQALGRDEPAQAIDVHMVSSGMQQVAGETALSPMKALLLGPTKVMAKEFGFLRARSVDVITPDAGSWQERRLVDQLIRELDASATDEVVALRGADRWVQEFEPLPLAESGPSMARVREGGVYLLTGGLGGIALTLADDIARSARVKLALISRTGLPPREHWDRHATGGDRVAQQVAQVRALEALGAEVLVLSADVTDAGQMTAIVAEVRRRLGPINGVLHTAGVVEDTLIPFKTAEQAARVLGPKLQGTLALDAALAGEPLAFIALFSSRGAVSAPAGQVDYVAANAFLDAYAQWRASRDGVPVVSINWSAWEEVGIAARLGGDASRPAAPSHPFLERRVASGSGETLFESRFSLERQWLLAEHRVRGAEALIPGTGYLELARAAAEESQPEGALELRDVFFLAPFVVPVGEARDLRVQLRAKGDAREFVITGRTDEAPWLEHAKGLVAHRRDLPVPAPVDPGAIVARCTARSQTFTGRNEREHLELGPRWNNIRRIDYGQGEAIARFELPAEYAPEIGTYRLHPALLDVATACAQQLMPGYDAHEHFFVPVSYGRLRAWDAIPARFYSHIRYLPDASQGLDIAAFDVTLLDEQGRVVVDISEFTMMRVLDKGAMAGGARENGHHAAAAPARGVEPAAAAPAGGDGIRPREGVEAFRRILAAAGPAQIVVSPQDLRQWMAFVKAPPVAPASPARDAGPAIDTGAIEAAILTHEAVREVAVQAYRDRTGEVRIVAFVAFANGEVATASELRRAVRERLSEELAPQHVVELDALPRTAKGEVDRAALVDPLGAADSFVAPRTPTEQAIAGIWSDLLGMDRVSVYDNFLDVGGHSLLAIRAVARIAKATGVRLSQSALNLQTLEQLAAECDAKSAPAVTAGAAEPAVVAPENSPGIAKRLFSAMRQTVSRN